MDTHDTTTTILFPHYNLLSENTSLRYTCEKILSSWEVGDVVTILADIGLHELCRSSILDDNEKEQVLAYKTEYFKKRFVVSRSIMKHVLRQIIGKGNSQEICLEREKKGRVLLRGKPDIAISLSYSGTCMALTLGKQRIGSDIEIVRRLNMRTIRSRSFFDEKKGSGKERILHYLQQWTMVEAYAKLRDMNLYPLINERYCLDETHFVSYLIDNQAVLTVASDSPVRNGALLRIDPEEFIHGLQCGDIAPGITAIPNGDTYARP